MTRSLIFFLILRVSYFASYAQQIPVIIQGATIHTGDGHVIKNGIIGFDSGKIVFVDSIMRSSYKNARFIDGKGKHVYPGLILLNTYLGLNEIDAVRSTRDYNETGNINPNVRALIAYNTDSRVTPTATHNGIIYMQVVPQGGLISGTSCVVKTDAMNWEDAAVSEDGIHLNWPEINRYGRNTAEEMGKRNNEIQLLNQFFNQARQYTVKRSDEEANLRLQSMNGVFKGSKNLYLHVSTAKGILEAITFIKEHKIPKPVLVTGSEASKVAEEIAAGKIPVIVNNIHSLPQYAHSDVDQPYKTVAELMKKGIITAIGHSGSWESRNVMFAAGTCAGYGIDKEQALKLITMNAAIISGTDSIIGVLAPGKNASLIISEGDVMDMRTSKVSHIFIDGLEIKTDNTQTELYHKYRVRYGFPE